MKMHMNMRISVNYNRQAVSLQAHETFAPTGPGKIAKPSEKRIKPDPYPGMLGNRLN
jgi:hypothetical protein